MQIEFPDMTKMQHEFLNESTVLSMNKSPQKKGPAVQCNVKMMENSICEMEIYGPHQTILNEDLKMWYKFVQNNQQKHRKKNAIFGFPLSCICRNQ